MQDGFPVGYNSTAAQGNYLEAINLSFNGKQSNTRIEINKFRYLEEVVIISPVGNSIKHDQMCMYITVIVIYQG